MRMLCVTSTDDLGGGELALLSQLDHCRRELELSAVVPLDGPLAFELRNRGIDVTVLGSIGQPSVPEIGSMTRCLASRIRARRPEFVYAVGNRAAVLCAPVASVLRVPLVWCKQDLAVAPRRAMFLSKWCRGVVAPSKAAGDGIEASRLAIVPPPVRLPRDFELPSPRPPATLACAGRLEPTKGHKLLIEAAAILCSRFQDLQVLLAGQEPRHSRGYSDELRRFAISHGLQDRVEFLGWVDSIGDLLGRSTVYVQPSIAAGRIGSEAFGMAIAEASWAGLPVVASRIGGVPEVVSDGLTGTLVPEGDSAALAAAIGMYLANPETARAAGNAGALSARERFDASTVSAEWLAALDHFVHT